MKVVKNISWFLYKIFAAYALLVIILIYFTPSSHWVSGFMMLSFPVVAILNLIFLVYWILARSKRAFLPAFITCLFLMFLPRTFAMSKRSVEDSAGSGKKFVLLNYNVSGFWVPGEDDKELGAKEMRLMRKWMVDTGADVMCLPEYYSNQASERVNVNAYFKKAGFKYESSTSAREGRKRGDYFGLTILSKFPVVYARDTSFTQTNGIALADLKIGKDTVRVIGVHLFSMTLRLNTLLGQRELPGLKSESKKVLGSMRRGFRQRAVQIQKLEDWITSSPYPVIVCGDFNETPYSYVYGRTREMLTNAFERKGKGFGFSFNKIPWFIRIDNQFYDEERLHLLKFQTVDSVDYSDHYPLLGLYEILKTRK